ncbi:tetratricopeptide repeat-containing sensor histidine kinase [Aureispira anguillae]|nr:histidine kinase dimerization/phosphoacceptor domain -containing protein [Aureispira anguillae]
MPNIDSLVSKVKTLSYSHEFRLAQNLVLEHLKKEHLSHTELFYGHFLLADITKSSGSPAQALEMLTRSKKYLDSIEQPILLESMLYGNMGECYFNLKEHDKAKQYALLSLAISPDSSLRDGGHAINHLIIGFNQFKAKKYPAALKYYKAAIHEYLAHNQPCELPLSYIKIARTYGKQGKEQQALNMLEKALELSDSCEIDTYRLLSHTALFNYYKDKKQYKKAFEFLDSMQELRRILYNKKQQQIIHDLEIKYHTELTQKENENLKRNALIQQTNNQFKITILVASIFILLFLLMFGIYILKIRNRKNTLLKQHLQKIESQSQERKALLKEIHHRVKNNLQVITSLLHLQANQNKEDNAQQFVQKSQYRINAMAMVHEMLYQSDDLSKINLETYLRELIHSLILTTNNTSKNIQLDLQVPTLNLGLDTAIPLGLLINEIVTNALIHGFKNKTEGAIYLHIKAQTAPKFTLTIGDNGAGCPREINFEKSKSLGIKLMKKLSRQLLGNIQLDKNKPGCHYSVEFQEIAENAHLKS